jgi:hypothetical protein
MKFNRSATEITEHTEIEKKRFLLCDGYYGRTNERSEQGFLFVLCGQISFCYGFLTVFSRRPQNVGAAGVHVQYAGDHE